MGLSWEQYNLIYYFIQYGLFVVIYVFLVICIPYDLMGWIAETILFLKDEHKQYQKTDPSTSGSASSPENRDSGKYNDESSCCCIWKPCDDERDGNDPQNWCSCCCLWMPLEEKDTSERKHAFLWCRLWMPLDDDKDQEHPRTWRSRCCIRWLFRKSKKDTENNTKKDTENNTKKDTENNTKKDTKKKIEMDTENNTKKDTKKKIEMDTEYNTNVPLWCTCNYIWDYFAKIFQCACRCWRRCRCGTCYRCCECCGCDFTSDDCENCLINLSYCCCECDCGGEDLKNKRLPHHHYLKLQRTTEQRYCGFIYLNMNRIGLYFLLCASLWCAAVVFFEGIILGYATANNGDSCPTPKRGTPATVVDCFIFQNAFDRDPTNTSYPTQCNSSMSITFNGYSAACFAWIYADVEVIDVIEELGICAGIVALLGSLVAVMGYLCRKHRWRFLFDIAAVLAIAAIPVLIYRKGDIPFMTYILLASLSAAIAITEYLLHYVPLLTWLCLVNSIFGCIKYRDKPYASRKVSPPRNGAMPITVKPVRTQ